jgi:membrane protease YdiL (CAAX protease family)
MAPITTWAKKRPLLAFFVLTYALSWMVEIPLALTLRGVIRSDISFYLHYLAGYGPMLAAIVVTGLNGGATELKNLFDRMTKWRVRPIWWLVAISPLGIYLLAGIFQRSQLYGRLYSPGILNLPSMFQWVALGLWSGLLNLGWVDFLPGLGLTALPMWVLTFGIGEETGWRGFALPRLQEGRSALRATIILWIFWALWHLPLFFYSYEVSVLPGFLTGLLAGAIVFTWLYNSTGGSVLMVALWHGTFNFTTACVTCKTSVSAAVISTLVMVWAVVVVLHFKPARLSRASEQVIGNILETGDGYEHAH